MSHILLLLQSSKNPESRSYSEYSSVNDCMAGLCEIFEVHLKRMNSNLQTIKYDISQLFNFLDEMADIGILVHQKSTNMYAPYNKEWIKEKVYLMLKTAAGSSV